MWIMISGPYRSGAPTQAERAANLNVMNDAAVAVLRKGHTPLIGVNMALPMIESAGAGAYDEIMMPVSLALAHRCDAVLRVGGPSRGADDEVDIIRTAGGQVFTSIDQVPQAE